jgi:ATP-dependent DNA helicase DinG
VEPVRDAVLALRLNDALLQHARISAEQAASQLELVYSRIHGTQAFEDKKARRFKGDELPDWLRQSGERLLAAARDLEKTFVAMREALLERAPSEIGLAARLLAAMGFHVARLDNLLATWELMLRVERPSDIPVVRWIESSEDARSGADYLICAAPIAGGERLRELLWERASALVLMSATLSCCGTFAPFLRQCGLASYRHLRLLQLDSPFDYRTHAKLVIAAMQADPSDGAAHTQEVVERLPHLVHGAGTLVLFASARQMFAVHEGLDEFLRRITLVQGSMPKMQMLARHRDAIDRGERSVLFGLQSLAEGVDLPGEYCSHVVWAKLPFAVPDTPWEEARREWVEARGGCAFIELSVPEAALRFKQGLGRLIRTTEDRGVVTVLDRRLVTKRWGALLLQGIPDFEVIVEEVPPTRV